MQSTIKSFIDVSARYLALRQKAELCENNEGHIKLQLIKESHALYPLFESCGNELAIIMESNGENSTELIDFMSYASPTGDIKRASELWHDLFVRLKRISAKATIAKYDRPRSATPISDIKHLERWASRISDWLSSKRPPNKHLDAIFLPHAGAEKAIMCLADSNPITINEVVRMKNLVDIDFKAALRGEVHIDVVGAGMTDLLTTLNNAISAIENTEPQPVVNSEVRGKLKTNEKPDQNELVDLVTLQQVAPLVHRQKRTLERYVNDMPAPKVQGSGGKASYWHWRDIKPWLEKKFEFPLPEEFTANPARIWNDGVVNDIADKLAEKLPSKLADRLADTNT